MRRLGSITLLLAALGLLAACQEQLAGPAACPELCPGTSLTVRDTVITASVGLDSSYTGYIGAEQPGALLVSDGLPGAEARAYATFPRRSDSVFVGSVQTFVALDSIAITSQLVARDSTVTGLKIFYYRIAPDPDSTVTLAALDAMMTPDALIDSLVVPDTLKAGTLRLVLPANEIARVAGAEADSGRVGLGLKIKADQPTGIRLGSTFTSAGPALISYGIAATTDTSQQKQTLTVAADTSNYVVDFPPAGGLDRLLVGGKLGTRTIIRFDIPKLLRDSATVLRATLELTPAVPVIGLFNDPVLLQVRGVLVDLGAKSPSLSTLVSQASILAGATDVQLLEVVTIVSAWFGPGNTDPTTLFMGVIPEGGSFGRPEFFSSLNAANGPRLRITYALPSRPGHP